MLNSTIVANINGDLSSGQKVSSGLHSSLLSPVGFTMTEIRTNTSAIGDQKRFLQKSARKGASNMIFNGQGKGNSFLDQNRNPQSKQLRLVNGNKNGMDAADEGVPVPKVYLYVGKINSDWQQVHKIGAGLYNLGNTCFMNTVLQCLTYCPPLANYLLHDSDHASKCRLSGFCMMCELQQHMKRAISRPGDVIKPLQIYQKLQCIAKHFQFGRQEDAHEFLRYLIDNLWKSCLSNHDGYTKLDAASKETTVVNQIFGGYHRSQVTCVRCKEKSNTYDHFMDLMLDVKQNVLTLEKALDKYIQPELLQNENAYKCPQCKMKVSAQKKFTVYKAPNVATFQFKRFDYHRMCGGKITKHISYPENLNLRPYMSNTKGGPVMYRLNAVLVHLGATCNSGHYFCYVRNSNGFWYVMDDARVQQVSLNQVLNQNAYVLFYVRVNPSETVPLKKTMEHAAGSIKNNHVLKNGFVGSGSCLSSSNMIGRPSPNAKSTALPGIAKLSVSTPSNNGVQNGTSTKLYHKQSLQPVSQKMGKIAFSINSPNANCIKENSLTKPVSNCTKDMSPASKTVLNGNTLVPYIEDSSSSDFSGDEDGDLKSKKQECIGKSAQTFSQFKVVSKNSTITKNISSNKEKVVKGGLPSKLFPSVSNIANNQSEKTEQCAVEKLPAPMKRTDKTPLTDVSLVKEKCENPMVVERENKMTNSSLTANQLLPNPCVVPSPSVKVNATSAWNVTEMSLQSPSIASGSSTNSVNSTTEWNAVDQELISRKKVDRNTVQVLRSLDRNTKNKSFVQAKLQKLKTSSEGIDTVASKDKVVKAPAAVRDNEVQTVQKAKLEIKQSSDSPANSVKLSKSPVTASAPDLCFSKLGTESVRSVDDDDDGNKGKTSLTSHIKSETLKIKDTNDSKNEPRPPFRNQSFQFLGTDTFLESNRNMLQQCTPRGDCETKKQNSLKGPISHASEDTSAKRPARFLNSNEDSNGPLHKKFKTNHSIGSKDEREYTVIKSYPKVGKFSNCDENKKDKCLSVRSLRTNLAPATSYVQSHSSSRKHYADSVFRHKDYRHEFTSVHKEKRTRERRRDEGSNSDTSSSAQSSKGKYEYSWVEKTKETIDREFNSKVPISSWTPDSAYKQDSRRHHLSHSSSRHSKISDVVSELQQTSSYIFGKDVDAWCNSKREAIPEFENRQRHYSSEYDDELDKGKVRRRKKNQYQRNYYKYNPFQAYEDRRNSKYEDNWRPKKHCQKSYHYEDRYYKKRHYRSSYKYFPRMHHGRHQHFHRH